MKTLSSKQVVMLKRIAQNNYPLNKKLAALDEKIAELEEEKSIINEQLKSFEAGVFAMTGGYSSGDLIDRVISPALDRDGNQKLDAKGMPATIAKFVPKQGVLVEQADGSFVIVEQEATGELFNGETETKTEEE